MSIEEASLTVPVEQRARFLARAQAVEARAQAQHASQAELRLALGVLSVLCGAPFTASAGS